ncbi:regulatory protein, Fis family [Desulfonatronum zhilinae]|nr:regulatory protein, Fis family [Desulfonatronum zhilinae]
MAQALEWERFDRLILLNNYPVSQVEAYQSWLGAGRPELILDMRQVRLSGPTCYSEIYQAALSVLQDVTGKSPDFRLTLHLSPGTPAMAAVWIILAKTRFPARLIESSRDHGVRVVDFPFDLSAEFLPDASRADALRERDARLERLSASLPPLAPAFADIIHRCESMRRVLLKARKAAVRTVPVLIEGESGTGKELLARAMHQVGPRQGGPFVAVNCGAIPTELVEAELFGHVKGAFTGAARARTGYFEAANQGTLFLDEIGELPLSAQVKVLRVLQENEVVRVGDTRPIPLDIRIMAATNRDLLAEVRADRFRADLFYRLAVAVLKLPALRHRPGDLSLLMDRLLEQVNAESSEEPGYQPRSLSPSARNLLLAHSWPGNVRELMNTLRRAAIWSDEPTIQAEDIQEALLPDVQFHSDKDVLNRPLDKSFDLQRLMAQVARHYLDRALEEAGDNLTKAAQILGLGSYQTLKNWMKKYEVE